MEKKNRFHRVVFTPADEYPTSVSEDLKKRLYFVVLSIPNLLDNPRPSPHAIFANRILFSVSQSLVNTRTAALGILV